MNLSNDGIGLGRNEFEACGSEGETEPRLTKLIQFQGHRRSRSWKMPPFAYQRTLEPALAVRNPKQREGSVRAEVWNALLLVAGEPAL